MGVHLTYSEIEDHPITEDESWELLRVLESHADTSYIAALKYGGFKAVVVPERAHLCKGFGLSDVLLRGEPEGLSVADASRQVVQSIYRWHEKLMLFYGPDATPELCLDVYAAVGIEPPDAPERTIGHGR